MSPVLALALLAAWGSGAAAASAPARDAADPFVRVQGHELTLGGKPLHFVGANLAIMHGPAQRAGAEAVLNYAARDGLRVARIWALGEGDAAAEPWLRDNFLFRAGPNGWIDAANRHLDEVVAAAGRAGIRLIITLANAWGDYGGVPRYLRWAGRWREGVYGIGDRFYGDPRTRAAFRAHVLRLLGRTNRVTGIRYRDDPTILAWELMNESTVGTSAGAAARRAFVVDMARFIHARDPNHLVAPGIAGYRIDRDRREWLAICGLPEVDFCDAHIYPEEMFGSRPPGTAGAALDAALDDYVRLTQTVTGKPFVLGEFGFRGDADGLWLAEPRAAWIARLLERLRLDGAAGALIWIYQPAGGTDRTLGITVPTPDGSPGIEALRAALRAAAAKLDDPRAAPAAGSNPVVADRQAPPLPLASEQAGPSPSVPVLMRDAPSLRLSWDPLRYARASWESTGIYRGAAIEHAWGAEVGWFEYQYDVPPFDESGLVPTTARPAEPTARAVTLRVHVSSEYPGSLSPPDGTSSFELSIDNRSVARAVAPPDDGHGRWLTLRADPATLPPTMLLPGRHRVRLVVPPGPHAHGLAVYGGPGEKPDRPNRVPDPARNVTGPMVLEIRLR